MALQVWIPGTTGNLKNQGLLQLPNPSYNSMSEYTSGKIGKAVQGVAMYHLLSDPFINQWSVACWVKFISGYSQYNNIILCLNTSDSEDSKFYLSIVNNTYLNIGRGSSSGITYTLSGGFIVNTWYHISATCDGTKTSLYLNGVLVNSGNIGTAKTALNLGIGCRSTNNSGTAVTGFSWPINDVRIYDHCLSPKEVHSISQALVLHYKLDDAYAKSVTNYSGQGNCSGWNNSGTATRTNDDTSVSNIPRTSAKTVSITQTADGQSALTFGSTTQNLPSKELTASVWFWWTGSYDGNSISPYIRSSKTDGNVANLLYNGSNNFRNWPQNTWIKLTTTFTSASDATTFYFCTYTSKTNQKFAFNAWQIEDGNTDSEFVSGSRSSSGIIYDDSGYQNDGTITGSLQIVNSEARYRKCALFNNSKIRANTVPINGDSCTLACWVKLNAYHSERCCNIIGCVYLTVNSSGKLSGYAYGKSPAGYHTGNKTIPLNTWTHIAITWNSTHIIGYVNGEQDFKISCTGNFNNNVVYKDFGIENDSGRALNGYMSDIRIYTTALSAEDVKSLYNVGAIIDNGANMHTYEYHEIESTTPKVHRTGVTDSSVIIEPDTITNASFNKAGIIKAKNFYEI